MRAVGRTPHLVDIAVNLTDCVFHGVDWTGKRIHEDDFEHVLARAERSNVGQIIITGTNLAQCEKAIALCRRYPDRQLLCTVGVHPAHCAEFTRPMDTATTVASYILDDTAVLLPRMNKLVHPLSQEVEEGYANARLQRLVQLIEENRDVVVAVGEIGLDYTELSYCDCNLQQKYFLRQLHSFLPLGLPFMLHTRSCGMHFVELLQEGLASVAPSEPLRGVVHSFNGDMAEQKALLAMGLYLSLNGSAFRLKELADQVVQIPRSRLMLETDSPWCDIRAKDYGYPFVKTHFDTVRRKKPFVVGRCLERRNEPCHLVQVVEAYLGCVKAAGQADVPTLEAITQILYDNCTTLFQL